MIKCDPRAKARCPFKNTCCGDETAYFVEGSECDAFNRKVLAPPPTNADRIRAMSDEELAKWLASRIANLKFREAEANGVMMTATWKAALYQRICMNLYDWFRRPTEDNGNGNQ